MATGSGKTLIMAANILYLYQKGYRNFIFFVHRNNILEKTKDNFLNSQSSKYLFADKIIFFGHEVKIKAVENFDGVNEDDINIMFCTINKLHDRLTTARENSLTEEDFEGKEIVLIADEAHHYQAYTRINRNNRQQSLLPEDSDEILEGLSTDEKEEFRAWETTIKKKILPKKNKNNEANNILLEFTATIDLDNPGIKEKYEDKIIYKYDLASFRQDKYSKEIEVLQASMKSMDRALQAIIISQYRRKIAEKHKLYLKPVILFKSKTIPESKINEDDFRKMISNLHVDDLRKISAALSPLIKKVFSYFKDNKISLNNLVKELQSDFSEEKCIAVNSKYDSAEKQLLVNKLEDRNNEIRAIFVVDMLNEGWDVLNLFDIVRLYDTRDARNNIPGRTTMAEAQLIGRGARYWPFVIDSEQNKFQRKYDRELDNDLRVLEQLYYHCSHNPDYLNEIKNALKQTGAIENNRQEIEIDLKKEFKNSDFYKKGKIFLNRKIALDKNKLDNLRDFNIKGIYQYNLPTYQVEEDEIMSEQFGLRQQLGGTDKISIYLGKLPQSLVRTALNRNEFFYFDNLKRFLPGLSSISDFISNKNYLSSVKIELSGLKKDIEEIEKMSVASRGMVLTAVDVVLANIANEIELGNREYEGSKEFEPEEIKKRLKKKKVTFDIANNRIQAENLALEISKKKWYAQTDFFGTTLEVKFLQFFDGFYDQLSKVYQEIILVRNEQFWPIYNFSDGQAFYPDFVLFLKKANKKKIDSLQVFIEPKGDIYARAETWKQNFLLQLETEGKIKVKWENENYKLFGLPFYNENLAREFEDALIDKLLK